MLQMVGAMKMYLAINRSTDKMLVINRMEVKGGDKICMPTWQEVVH